MLSSSRLPLLIEEKEASQSTTSGSAPLPSTVFVTMVVSPTVFEKGWGQKYFLLVCDITYIYTHTVSSRFYEMAFLLNNAA